jgi:hypothetical protein
MSFFDKEMQRLDDLRMPDIPAFVLRKPEVKDFLVELQRSTVCWEPWLLQGWKQKEIEALNLSSQYLETLRMTAMACAHDEEQYMELYLRFRDHNEFQFERFFIEASKIAEQAGFEWEGPMDALPPTPRSYLDLA